MKKLIILFFLLAVLPKYLFADDTKTVGTSGADYPTLNEAFFDINNGILTGVITLQIIDNITESATAELFESGYGGSSSYTSLIIYPTSSGLIITGDIDGPLISLNGADNVTFDGRVDTSGTTKDLVITNTSTGSSASTIQFSESATSNNIRYCIIKGSETSATSGVIFFSTATVGNGNDGNVITKNSITSDAAGRPVNEIYSSGTSGSENSGNTISNNDIYNFLKNATASNGILLAANTTSFTISGNSFYESSTFIPAGAVAYNIIQVSNTSGTDFSITGNYIGGQAALCGGSPWTKSNASTNAFTAISLNVGTGTVSNVQNNTIKNINWSNTSTANWIGIYIAGGAVDIGTTAANTIGTATGNGSITVTSGATGTNVYGINIVGTGTVNCRYNIIGSITAANSPTLASNLTGINKTGAGTTVISNNAIGSTSTSNSLYASSGATSNAQTVIGINNTGTGTITINSNTIANLTNNAANTSVSSRGRINGIVSSNGTNTISGNTIRDLSIANANDASNQIASVCGIALTGVTALKTITGNIIYNLSNTYTSFVGSVVGLFFTGSTGGNIVSANFIHSLSVSASTNSASIYGINISSGATTYSNNIIYLGGSTLSTLYGIYESGASGNDNNLYFNTIYIGGTVSSGTNKSYALYSAVTSNTRNFRNNIFVNARSTTAGSSLHYAAYILSTGGIITCNYNDYYVSGTYGAMLGYYGGDKSSLPIVTSQDTYSLSVNPGFAYAGSTVATDYKISVPFVGVSGTGIASDYEGTTRVNPTIGAFELPINKWKGTTDTDWSTGSNWTVNVPQGTDINLIFDVAPLHHLYLDTDRSVTNITNGQGTYNLSTNTHKLTIKGTLNFTGGAQIDASSAGSTVEFAGTSAQTIPTGTFNVYNLIVNNPSNIVLNGTLNLINNLTLTSGLIDATSSTATMGYGGSVAQTITASQFVSGKVYNLSIANSNVVSVNSDFTVDNNLSITSGNITVNAPYLLTVTGTLSNSAGVSGLVIKSSGNGSDAKLINNTSSVNGTVELSLSGGTGDSGPSFHYFVPPVTSMTIGSDIAAVRTNLGLTNFYGDLLNYSEPAAVANKNAGWQYFDGYGSTTPFSTISSTMGYNFYVRSADKATFKGALNGGAHSFSLSFTGNPDPGWNLTGNPYPCNYDLSGVPELTATDNVNNSVYFNHDGGYGFWNVELNAGTSGFSSVIAPMQGFFVRVTASATMNLPVGSKTVTTAVPLRSKGAIIVKKIKMVLNNGAVPDETIICLVDNATSGFDGDYDAFKLFGTGSSTPFIYTELNAVKYALNAIKDPGQGSAIIPVTVVIKTAGTYNIDITEFENLEGVKVVLKHGTIETPLSKNTSYSFTSLAGTFTDFQLIIGESGTSTTVEPLTIETINTWYSNSYLYISCPDNISTFKGSLIIYDIQGKMVYNSNQLNIAPGQTTQLDLNLPKGMYITHVIVNNQPYISKIVVF